MKRLAIGGLISALATLGAAFDIAASATPGPGPLQSGNPDAFVAWVTPGRHHFFADGWVILENPGSSPATLDSITESPGSSHGVQLRAVYVAGRGRSGPPPQAGSGEGGADRWPPLWVRAAALRHARGMIIPAHSGSVAGAAIITRIVYPARPGTYLMGGYVVRYHVGSDRYVLTVSHRVIGCVYRHLPNNCGSKYLS